MPKISDLLDASTLAGDEYVYVLQSGQDRRSTVTNLLSGLAGFGGDITGVTAGAGLTGGGTSGTVTLNVSFGSVAGTVASGADARLIGALQTTGGTMTGALTLSGAPSAPLHAATKAYVDSTSGGGVGTITGVTAGTGLTGGGTSGTVTLTVSYGTISGTAAQGNDSRITGALQTTGGTMTGLLTLSGAPTSGLHAATKAYVDSSVGAAGGGTITGVTAGTGLTGGGSTGTVTLTVSYGTVSGTAAQGNDSRIVNALPTTGGTMSGTLTLAATQAAGDNSLKAATTAYSDRVFSSTAAGAVPASGGGTVNYLRADGTFAAPAGGGSGTVGSATSGQLAYYSATGTAVSGLTLGTNLSIIGGTLNAASGGGSGTITGVTAGTGLTGGGTTGTVTLTVSYGTAAGTAAQGNDSRITGALQATTAATTYAPLALTGLSTATNAVVTASDTVLGAFGKLQAQVNDYPISVKRFGAVGNGTTDDTAAIQAAIDALAGSAASGGGIVWFPVGNYLHTGITLKHGVTLRGATQVGINGLGPDLLGSCLLLKAASTGPSITVPLKQNAAASYPLNLYSVANVGIENLSINGNKANVTNINSHGIYFAGSAGFVTLTANRTSGSTSLTGCSTTANIEIGSLLTGTGIATGAYVAAIAGTTITMSAAATSTGTAGTVVADNLAVDGHDSASTMRNVYIYDTAGDGVRVLQAERNILFDNVHIQRAAANGFNSIISDHRFINCVVEQCGSVGFLIGSAAVNLVSCISAVNAIGVRFQAVSTGSANCRLTDCTIDSNSQDGVVIDDGVSGVTIIGGMIDSNSRGNVGVYADVSNQGTVGANLTIVGTIFGEIGAQNSKYHIFSNVMVLCIGCVFIPDTITTAYFSDFSKIALTTATGGFMADGNGTLGWQGDTDLFRSAAGTLATSVTFAPNDLNVANTGKIAGAWTVYTPTAGASTGTLGTNTPGGRYRKIARIVHIEISLAITTIGTAAGQLTLTLPFTPATTITLVGRDTATNKAVVGHAVSTGTTFFFTNYDGTLPGSGANCVITGTYESAS